MKTIILTRAVSGSGKSTFTNLLCQNIGYVSVSSDRYFIEDGVYKFDSTKLGWVHKQCQQAFMEALKEPEAKVIIVDNTNTSPSEWEFYEDEGRKAGANVVFLVLENRHGGKDSHSVPEAALQRQESNLRSNLKFR